MRQAGANEPVWHDSSLGVTRLAHAPEDLDLVVHAVSPPASEIAKRVLAASASGEVDQMTAFEELSAGSMLSSAWTASHVLQTPAHAEVLLPMPPGKSSLHALTLCQRVGYCVCGPGKLKRRKFRAALASWLKSSMSKGSTGRRLHDRAELILQVSDPCKAVPSPLSTWYVGYGNLNSNDFTVKPLKRVWMAQHHLVFEPDGDARDIEAVGASLDLENSAFVCDLMMLDIESGSLFQEFRPLAFVAHVLPRISCDIWPPKVSVPNPVQSARRRTVAAASIAAEADMPSICDGNVEAAEDDVMVEADEALAEAATWQLSSDDDDAVDDRTQSRPGISTAGLSSIVHGSRPPTGLSLSVAVRPPATSSGSSGGAAASGTFIPRKDFRSFWPKIDFAINERGQRSYLRLSTTWGKTHQDLLAVCCRHGPRCQLSKSMRSQRHIGRLWAWLQHGERPEVQTKEQHVGYDPSYQERLEGRSVFEGLAAADIAEFLASEPGGPGLGEPLDSTG